MKRLTLSLALVAFAGVAGVQAQTYPTRAVTIIVPFAAGGPADITGRIAADQLSRQLGQQFVVENVGGAGGTTGATRAARAAPDGYTLLLGHLGTQAAAVALYPKLAYNPQTDFEAIGLVGEQPELLVTRKDAAAEQPQGIRRLRQGEREQAEHGARRRRLGVLHRLPAVQHGDRDQADAGAVHRHGAGAQCHAGKPSGLRLRSDPGAAAARARRHAQGAGDHLRQAPSGAARRSDLGGRRAAAVQPDDVLRAVRAQGHAAGDRRQACRRARQGARRRGRAQAPDRPRRRDPRQEPARTEAAGGNLVKSEIARLTPILSAAGAK